MDLAISPIGPSLPQSIYVSSFSQPCSVYRLPEKNEIEVEDGLACPSPESDRPWRAAQA